MTKQLINKNFYFFAAAFPLLNIKNFFDLATPKVFASENFF